MEGGAWSGSGCVGRVRPCGVGQAVWCEVGWGQPVWGGEGRVGWGGQ